MANRNVLIGQQAVVCALVFVGAATYTQACSIVGCTTRFMRPYVPDSIRQNPRKVSIGAVPVRKLSKPQRATYYKFRQRNGFTREAAYAEAISS
jgi:hypothetical protein